MKEISVGKGRIIREGKDIAILSIGHVGNYVVEASKILEKENIDIAHYDMRFVKPLDEDLLHKVAKKYKRIITIEDGTIVGGFGSAILEFMSKNSYSIEIKRLGVPDKFIEQGSFNELIAECGFDVEGIVKEVRNCIK